MFPTWFLVAFYTLCALAIGWLLFRKFSRRPGLRLPRRQEHHVEPTPQKRVEQVMTAATSAPPPLPRNWERRDPPQIAAATPLPHGELPRLRPDETPLARDDEYFFGPITPGLAALLPDSDTRRGELRQELQTAGYYTPHALTNFSAIRYALMMTFLIAAGVLLILVPTRFEPFAIGAVIAGPILGWSLPRLHIRSRSTRRKSEIEQGMPDLLDMMNMCVSQGLTVPDAIRRILPDLRLAYPALAQELRIVMEQARLGNLHQALRNFDQRINLPEVHSFTSLLIQTDRMGTSVSEALTTYSDSMREGLKQRADEKGNRATFRLLFPTVFCLMPAVYLFLLGPAIIGLSDFFKSGGRDGLDTGSRTIQRINNQRDAGQVEL